MTNIDFTGLGRGPKSMRVHISASEDRVRIVAPSPVLDSSTHPHSAGRISGIVTKLSQVATVQGPMTTRGNEQMWAFTNVDGIEVGRRLQGLFRDSADTDREGVIFELKINEYVPTAEDYYNK